MSSIENIKSKMLIKYPFFGSVVANVSYKENSNIETAGTDGKTIYYNKEFLDKLNTDDQIFLLAHEVCHIALDHINRSEGKNKRIWNLATDGVINQFLKRDGLKLIDGCVDIPDALNYDAEELYDKLLKENEQSKNESESQSNSFSETDSTLEQNHDVGHDTHSMWPDAVKKKKELEKEKEKDSNKSKEEKSESDREKENKLKEAVEEISKIGEKEAFNRNREEKIKQLEELKKILSKESLEAGTSTNGKVIVVNDIGRSKPIIDWRYALREAITYDVDWSYKNAYIEDGVVSANLEEQPIPETEIVLDTSGSIDKSLLKNFLRECKNILKISKLKVGCFDTIFYGFNEIRTEEDIENMEFKGGGGTNFNVAVNAFTRRVENKIIFTDGCADMPSTKVDAIWIVFGDNKINPIGGKVIQIDKEQLDSLSSLKCDTSIVLKKGKKLLNK